MRVGISLYSLRARVWPAALLGFPVALILVAIRLEYAFRMARHDLGHPHPFKSLCLLASLAVRKVAYLMATCRIV